MDTKERSVESAGILTGRVERKFTCARCKKHWLSLEEKPKRCGACKQINWYKEKTTASWVLPNINIGETFNFPYILKTVGKLEVIDFPSMRIRTSAIKQSAARRKWNIELSWSKQGLHVKRIS